jgi:WD40 repeat protein
VARPHGQLPVLGVESGDLLDRFGSKRRNHWTWGVDTSGDGERLAISGSRGVEVLDAATGAPQFTVAWGRARWLYDVAWSRDGEWLAVVFDYGDRGEVRVFDRSGAQVARLDEVPGSRTTSVSFSADGRFLATTRWGIGTVDPTRMPATIWDWELGRRVDRVDTSAEYVEFDPSGELIATSRPVEGTADVWEAGTGRRVATLTASSHVRDLAFDVSGSRLATAHADGTVRLWDPETGVQRLVLDAGDTEIQRVRFSVDGSKLLTQDAESQVRVWALDVEDLVSIARSRLTRGFSADECRQYLHLESCPDA